ncbi:protein AF-9 [Grus japonensis]|uniref:Protein AF-9 n=1 Tax=Grus japonensis TaxID=30415 RepID=A0ABC9Y311_GRUJA
MKLQQDEVKCAVQVKLELGHRAQVRKKPTVEGFTHDWMVFVRGPEHSNIQHFVEKVVFHLHESFPRPKRGLPVCKACGSTARNFTAQLSKGFKEKLSAVAMPKLDFMCL